MNNAYTHSKRTLAVVLCTALALSALCAAPSKSKREKDDGRVKFICANWGSPTLDKLKKNVDKYEEAAPFDGIIISMGVIDVMNAAEPLKYNDYIKGLVKKYRSIKFKKYKHNFVSTMIDQHEPKWLDDKAWEVIANNWRVAAKVAKKAGFVGILFDPEGYGTYPVNNYWTSAYYMKTDILHKKEDYLKAARKRGQQVGEGMFKEFPELKLFGFYLWSFRSDLMGEFCNGILDKMPKDAAMIDGDEWRGYCAKNDDVYKNMKKNSLTGYGLLDKKHRQMYRKQGQIAPAFYLDAYARPAANGCLTPTVNQVGPLKLFRNNIKAAKRYSGGYIWIYGEQGTWWKSVEPNVKYEDWDVQLPGFKKVLFNQK